MSSDTNLKGYVEQFECFVDVRSSIDLCFVEIRKVGKSRKVYFGEIGQRTRLVEKEKFTSSTIKQKNSFITFFCIIIIQTANL